jgi:hypothetical protein
MFVIQSFYKVLEVCLMSFYPALPPVLKLNPQTSHLEPFHQVSLNSQKSFTRHQAPSTMHKLLSRAENNGTKPLPQVSDLTHFVSGFVPAVSNLTRKNLNEIKRGWLRTCTAGQASVPAVKLLDNL